MHNLGLTGARFDHPADVVRWLGVVQAQDYGPAKWSVAQRAPGLDDRDLDASYEAGDILRTHLLRPTWHFVHPDDIRWLLEVSAPRVHALNAYMYRSLELDSDTLIRCSNLIAAVLTGGNRLTRREIQAILQKAGIVTDGMRTGYIIMSAELNGVVCSGGLEGKQHTYALLEERAWPTKTLSHDEALKELTLRYFTSHGPATAKDLKHWSSLTVADVKKGLALAGPRLYRDVIDGLEFWFTEPAPSWLEPFPVVHLLQGYDEYVMGYRESRWLLDIDGGGRLRSDRALPTGLIVLDTQVAGHWRRVPGKDSILVEALLYSPFGAEQALALKAAADSYGKFLGLPVTVEMDLI